MVIRKEIFPQNSPVCIPVLWLSFLSITPPVFHTDYFITDRRYVTLTTGTVVKQHELQSLEELTAVPLLGQVAKFRKATISFVSLCVCVCVCLSVRPSVLPHGTT